MNLRVATSYSYKGKDGKYVDETDWHGVVVNNPTQNQRDTLVKGAKAFFSGPVRTRSYDGSDGQKRYVVETIAFETSPMSNGSGESAAMKPAKAEAKVPAPTGSGYSELDAPDDDIPF